ncbi:hypothetical protein MBLNU230_g7387t1 [Neophaeotheca triangularis]
MARPAAFAALAVGFANAVPQNNSPSAPVRLDVASQASNSSIQHTNSFGSFSIDPAFWIEFFGNASSPNEFIFELLDRLDERGAAPTMRPGGISMDSMVFDENAGDLVRTEDGDGGIFRSTVGPAYYQSWDNFPESFKFVSTLNFDNESLPIAQGLAVASARYQAERILYFELGNEPTNYPSERWNGSTEAYVEQWQSFIHAIDEAVDAVVAPDTFASNRWWASSATTDETPLDVRPADLIPAGVDSNNDVGEYSIHSYPFSTCDPERLALATTENVLNHTGLRRYAIDEIYPSAQAAQEAGKPWNIGEFNSISCAGRPNVSDTFAQALWVADTYLIYASLNASSVFLHNGAALVFQSDEQLNEADEDGSPGYSTYSFAYPLDSNLRGPRRALPSFVAQLMMAEAFATSGTRVAALSTPAGVNGDGFAAYGFFGEDDSVSKVALLNMNPYYANSTQDYTVSIENPGDEVGYVKRMTAPYVDTGDTTLATWAGQSFEQGTAVGEFDIEELEVGGTVSVRGSEAVLIFYNRDDVYGLNGSEETDAPYPVPTGGNDTAIDYPTGTAAPTAAPTGTEVPVYEGAASKASVGMGFLGLIAYAFAL